MIFKILAKKISEKLGAFDSKHSKIIQNVGF
jgi:hypothetical protein